MVYRKSYSARRYARKVYRKGKSPFNSYMRTKRLVKLINKVSLKKAETKSGHRIYENEQLYHNVPAIQTGFMATNQGIGDTDAGYVNVASRLGNEIVLRGLSVKVWLANKLDRPNVMYRILIYRYKTDGSYTNPPYLSQGTANYMIRDIDTDNFKVIKSKRVNIQAGFSAVASTTTQGDQNSVEAHKFVKFYVPLKNQRYKYKANDSAIGAYWDMGMSIVCYDSYGTLITDNIASYALSYKLYFKDP